MKAGRLVGRILQILEHHGFAWPDGTPPKGICIRRTRAGHVQRSTGAWSWHLWADEHASFAADVGSQWAASDVASWGPDGCHLFTNMCGQTSILPTPDTIKRMEP